MKRSNELDVILDECLERMFAGETIEACLDSYPEHAGELAPLLQTAADTMCAIDIKPRPEFRQQASMDFQNAVRDMRPADGGISLHVKHWWVGVVAAIAVIVIAGGGTVAASTGSMPDSPLYTVKTATENVRLAMAISPSDKAELYAEFADRRVDEIVAMAEAGNVEEINNITDKLNTQLVAMAEVFEGEDIGSTFGMSFSDDEQNSLSSDTTMTQKSLLETDVTEPPMTQTDPVPAETTTATPTVTTTPTTTMTASIERGEMQPGEVTSEGGGDNLGDDFFASVVQDSLSNSIKLQDAITDATDSVKEALERALAIANAAYSYAISNIR